MRKLLRITVFAGLILGLSAAGFIVSIGMSPWPVLAQEPTKRALPPIGKQAESKPLLEPLRESTAQDPGLRKPNYLNPARQEVSLGDLMKELEVILAKKAELLREQQKALEAIREKVKQQREEISRVDERLQKMGLGSVGRPESPIQTKSETLKGSSPR